jgi:transcription elongation factor GreA
MSPTDDVVRIGSRVRVEYTDTGDAEEFTLVSPECDRAPDPLSTDAPLGRALLGRRVGERCRVRAPSDVYGVIVVAVS